MLDIKGNYFQFGVNLSMNGFLAKIGGDLYLFFINGKIKSYVDFFKSRGATENFLSCKKFLHLLDMENNSQENVIEPIETAIDINSLSSETKDDNININSLSSDTKDDNINNLSSET